MLKKIREMANACLSDKLNEFHLAADEDISLEEKLAVVCLMLYYFRDGMRVKQLSFACFEHYKDRVKTEKITQIEPEIDKLVGNGRSRGLATSIALMGDLLVVARKRLELAESDKDVEPIAIALVKEYFV